MDSGHARPGEEFTRSAPPSRTTADAEWRRSQPAPPPLPPPSPLLPAHADVALGTASATPPDHLASGQVIEVTVGGFPANATVYGVQCDQRVVSTGDNAYCDTTNVAVVSTGADGSGTATSTVKAGEDFTAANGQGVCDATSSCQLAFQHTYGTDTTVAVTLMDFGTRTFTLAEVAGSRPRAGKSIGIDVLVLARSQDVPSGSVTLRDGKDELSTGEVPASGELTLQATLPRGRHLLKVVYGGDADFTASSDRVVVRVR